MCKHKVHLYETKSRRNYIYSCISISSYVRILSKESTHDRVVVSRVYDTGLTEYIGREVAPMTAYEIISIFIGILALLMSVGSLIVALLAFLDKRNKRK